MGRFTIVQFICEQRQHVPPVIEGDLTGKVIMVVGANGGIGFEACKHYARMNPAKLILACRSKERGNAALRELEETTGYRHAELRIIDLASFASVSAFADAFEKEEERLDILVENAGITPPMGAVTRTDDGWESTLQVNDLSTSLLALLLFPTLLRTANTFNTTPRLVVVASDSHFWTKLDEKLIAEENPLQTYNSDAYWTAAANQSRYFDTKLINILFVRALSNRLGKDHPVIVSTVNPGYCASNLRSSFHGIYAMLDKVMEKAFAHTSEEGSRQLVWGAVGVPESGDVDELRGAYISGSRVLEPSDWVISEEGNRAEDKIWENLISELAKVEPKVKEVVDQYLKPFSYGS